MQTNRSDALAQRFARASSKPARLGAAAALAGMALLGVQGCHRGPAPDAVARNFEKPSPLPASSVRFAVIGDFGDGSADEMEVGRMVASWDPSFVITVGDNNQPDGRPEDLEPHVAAAYGQFIPGDHGAYGVGSPEPRFFPALGNHDWRTPAGLKPYADFFRVPGNGRYYEASLAGGRVQLFSLDSDPHEPDGTGADSKQARWLRERAAAAPTACLRIVAFHHPSYSSALHGSSQEMRWPFKSMGVDAVLTGHDHVYERLEEDGLPYFVDGLGGASIYPFRTELAGSKVRYNAAHGAMLITVSPDQTRYEMWSVRGEQVDSLTVPKPCTLAAAPPAPTPGSAPRTATAATPLLVPAPSPAVGSPSAPLAPAAVR